MSDSDIFVVSVKSGGHVILAQTALSVMKESTFENLFDMCHAKVKSKVNLNMDMISSISIKSGPKIPKENGIDVSLDMKTDVAVELACKFVDFELISNYASRSSSESSTSESSQGADAFAILMAKVISLPPKHKGEKLIAPQRLFNDLVDWTAGLGSGWSKDTLETGIIVLSSVNNALWYVDHCHQKLKDNGCAMPEAFGKFQGYNEYVKQRHKTPQVTSEKLDQICNDLAKAVSFPSMNTARNKKLCGHVDALLDSLAKYKERLNSDNIRHKAIYQVDRDDPIHKKDTSCTYIAPKQVVDDQFDELNKIMQTMNDYEYIDLHDHCPDDRYKRRKFVQDLRLSKGIMLLRMAYGGCIGTLNFIWNVPLDDSPERSQQNAVVMTKITDMLPQFSTREMRREFIQKYSKHVKAPKSILRHMFFDLTGYDPSFETAQQQEIDSRAAEILLDSGDPDLLLDYRALNRQDIDTHFGPFFEEMGKFFEEQLLAVQDRRHGEELYMPLALSIEDLKRQIIERVAPGTAIPSSETIRLQFMPSNPLHKTSLHYTGRFNVKYRVQARQARVHHQDTRFVAMQFRYLKQFCVKFRDFTTFVCLDDKAVIPVGEPGVPISTGVRGHNRVLAPASGPELVATDHDFHVGGLVPSVTFISDIPTNSLDSFFRGKICVTTKDKVFEASSPFRHATELLKILREHLSQNETDLDTPILAIMTDGGPDHRLTYETVKASLVEVFMQLDLDMLVAIRTAPNHSWVNPAERCMSILNLALQHVALARSEMDKKFESKAKNKSSLTALRNLATYDPQFKEAFAQSIGDVRDLVNDRFSRMRLKEEAIRVYKGAKEEDIDGDIRIVNAFTRSDINKENNTKDMRAADGLQVSKIPFKNSNCML